MIDQFVTSHVLSKQVEFITGIPTFVLNQMPSVFKENQIYIILPEESEIRLTPYISGGSLAEFTISIVQVAHEASMNRQKELVDDVYAAMYAGTTILEKCIPRFTSLENINNSAIRNLNYGTSTWVTDTKIYTLFKIDLSMVSIVDY